MIIAEKLARCPGMTGHEFPYFANASKLSAGLDIAQYRKYYRVPVQIVQ